MSPDDTQLFQKDLGRTLCLVNGKCSTKKIRKSLVMSVGEEALMVLYTIGCTPLRSPTTIRRLRCVSAKGLE